MVLDATTGQNAVSQAKLFGDVVPLTGVVLTKLDGTAKGGVILSIKRELGVPVRWVGVGEGVDDLRPFDAAQFADASLIRTSQPAKTAKKTEGEAMIILEEVGSKLTALRRERPLIHHITNLSPWTTAPMRPWLSGASPTMTNSVEEVAEMAGAAKALVLNLGTLQQWTLEAMVLAGKAAAANGVPIIFDPVGAGGTTFRTQAALRLVQELPLSVIRGNAAEITCLANHQSGQNLGVDSLVRPVDSALRRTLPKSWRRPSPLPARRYHFRRHPDSDRP